jgi:putative membrane protein
MHIRKLIAIPALAGTMLLAQQTGQTSQASANPDQPANTQEASTVSPKDHKFMVEAARGGKAEVELAQMAQQKASSDAVKQYARQLEQDHTEANKKLKAIAQERGVQLPDDLGQHQKTLDMLNSKSGEEFDRAFMKSQVQHHKKDINQFRKASKNVLDSDLREFATSTLPTLEQHLRQAETVTSQTGTRARTQ